MHRYSKLGVLFNSMGHSVRRPIKYSPDEQPRLVTKLELLSEEALYLVERGSMLCFRQDANSDFEYFDAESNSFAGNPMTVQQAFADPSNPPSIYPSYPTPLPYYTARATSESRAHR